MASQSKYFDVANRGTFTEAAGLSSAPVPMAPYYCPEFFEKEKKRIFERAWLLIGRVEELPEPGSFFVKDILPTSVVALITRDNHGRIQAFHNTCSHRGSQVVYASQGKQSRFVCPYHNWTYRNDGTLLSVTDECNFFNIDKPSCGLTKIHTEVWEGWIFINIARKPEVSLEEFLCDFKPFFEGFEYLGASNPVIVEAEMDVNWKVMSDAFIEAYHIPAIHPQTLTGPFSHKDNPWGRLVDAAVFGPHRRVSMFGNPAYEGNPEHHVEALAARLVDTTSPFAPATSEGVKRFRTHPAVNPSRSQSWSMDANMVFPHVQIDSGHGGFWAHWFWPISATRARYEGKFYMTEAPDFATRLIQELYISRVYTAICEDVTSMMRTQRGLSSGGKDVMQLQDSEIGIRHHIDQCIKWVEAPTVREALA